jgi:hypothetical protein
VYVKSFFCCRPKSEYSELEEHVGEVNNVHEFMCLFVATVAQAPYDYGGQPSKFFFNVEVGVANASHISHYFNTINL